ncbi:hypothetical protein HK44_011830 [Pseudomonas fluorescens HK44]|uniref:Uncharacterized protein n=1 Tax=Pseudomonas fluorescens HK44 TaxID=1042209 RepID=A0A010RIS8_PSEFL|nr:hypothetical protein [Pseudomonas fluorescens]EXF92576.1 hypothetical protein HK44_011830 [Pseudomonas fluorescens HK44]
MKAVPYADFWYSEKPDDPGVAFTVDDLHYGNLHFYVCARARHV